MKLLKKCKIVLPVVITAVLLCIIYAIKHIYPFGKFTVDYYDMAQQIAAFYYHIYDFLHGEKALFLDPYTALSVNMSMSTSGCSHLSIFNLFFLFVKRNMLLESFSYFLMLKMMLMSASMYIYLHKSRKLPYLFEIIFSVGYAFCGFVFVLYVTIQWMDIAVLFPIIMLYLHKVLKNGKSIGYIVTLTLSIIASYYISFMILIFIVLIVGLEMSADRLFEKDETKRKNLHLTGLFVETVVSICLSLFILLPQLKQTLMSARFNNESSGGLIGMYREILSSVNPAYTTRWFTLLGLSFAFAVIYAGLIKNYKNKKIVYLSVGTIIIMLTELFVESVNLIWHFGSYVQYPIRNGFIIYFTVVLIAAYFIENEEIRFSGFSHIVISVAICIAALLLGIRKYGALSNIPVRDTFHILAFVMAACFVLYFITWVFDKGKMTGMIPVFMAAEIIFYGFVFIGQPTFITGYSEEPEQEGEYIRICNQLSEAFHIRPDEDTEYLIKRIKNPDESLNANYGLVLRRPALSNWTHLLNPKLADSASKLGYTVQFTRLLDSGGTVFSDALLGVKNIITCVPQNSELYTLRASKEIVVDSISGKKMYYYYYECKYNLPFGIVSDPMYADFENDDIVGIYNDIYEAITSDKRNIAEWIYNRGEIIADSSSIRKVSITPKVKGKRALYYLADQVDTDDYNTTIIVNDKIVKIPSIKEIDNELYPAHFNNNAVLLGVFINESVKIDVQFSGRDKDGNIVESKFDPKIMSVSLDRLAELRKSYEDVVTRSANKKLYEFKLNSDDGKYLTLPLAYDKGYHIYNNGTEADILSIGDIFISIPLKEGVNDITVKYFPDGMKVGICVSLVTLVICIVYFIIDRKKNIRYIEIPQINNIYFVGWCAVIIFMYVIPVVYGVISWIV